MSRFTLARGSRAVIWAACARYRSVGNGRLHVCHVNSYCRGVIEEADEECDEALAILENMSGQLNSEVYHAIQNGDERQL